MPNITIEGPRITDINVKRALVKELTDAAEKAYNIPREHIIVIIKANEPEDVGTGGVLVADRRKP